MNTWFQYKNHKFTLLTFTCLFLLQPLIAQPESLTIEACYEAAYANYPSIRQKDLIAKIKEYTLDNASKGYLPQLSIHGQVTYQSDVTQIPIALPDLEIPTLSKDQYKIYAEVQQPLTDGYMIRQQKQLVEANAEVEKQKIEVELYKLKERINELYFGILLIHAQIDQNELLKKDVQSAINKTNAAIANGVALKSSGQVLKAQLLKSDQRTIELKASLSAYLEALGNMIGRPLDENTVIQTPVLAGHIPRNINRPELKLFDVQLASLNVERKLLMAAKIPKLALFLQTGYGKPALNLLKDKFDFYYLGGIRFSWPLTSFYTYKNDMEIKDLTRDILNVQKETLLFNTNMNLTRQESEIQKLEELIKVDEEIVTLYEGIQGSYLAQLENGTLTTGEYLTHLNEVDLAQQNRVIHMTQLTMAQYNYMTSLGQ
jgi:outer membrane protein TolC